MNSTIKKLFASLSAAFCACGAVNGSFVQCSTITANAEAYAENGELDGYSYEIWNWDDYGDASFTNSGHNGFTASWKGIHDCRMFKGKYLKDENISAYQVNECKVTYDLDLTVGENDFAGVSGWFTEPKTNFYIVETYNDWVPSGMDKSKTTTVKIDGVTYDLYSINSAQMGNTDHFRYIWSVARKEPFGTDKEGHTEGTVDVAAHFRAWDDAGFELGTIYNICLSVDAYYSSGSAKLNSLDISYDISDEEVFGPTKAVLPYEEHDPLRADDYGTILEYGFEDESGKAGAFGDKAVSETSDDVFYGGEHSIHISSSDGDSIPAFYYELDPYDLSNSPSTGERFYYTGANVFNNSKKDAVFDIELIEYSDLPFEYRKTDRLGKRYCRAGQWTKIKDIAFEYAHNIRHRYRIALIPETPADYYVDDFCIANRKSDYNSGNKIYKAYSSGDLNGDGVTDSLDIAVCRRAVIDSAESCRIETAGDVNGDLRSDVSDLVLLTKYVLRISDEIPVSYEETKLLIGDRESFLYSYGALRFTIAADMINDDRIKTALRENNDFTAEWNDTEKYTCHAYDDYSHTIYKKPSSDFDISYSADIKATGKCDVVMSGEYCKGDDLFYFRIVEGRTGQDNDDILKGDVTPSIVVLNGREYYMVKSLSSDIYNDNAVPLTELYRKDDPIADGEMSHLENSFNLEELLQCIGEDDKSLHLVHKLCISVEASESSGYIDFKELKFSVKE